MIFPLINLLIVLLFFVSGFNKVMNLQNTVNGFMKKFNFPYLFAFIIIFLVIVLEIFAPIIILRASLYENRLYDTQAYYSTIALFIFTILATILYYVPPVGDKYMQFFIHLSLAGGLLGLAYIYFMRLKYSL